MDISNSFLNHWTFFNFDSLLLSILGVCSYVVIVEIKRAVNYGWNRLDLLEWKKVEVSCKTGRERVKKLKKKTKQKYVGNFWPVKENETAVETLSSI